MTFVQANLLQIITTPQRIFPASVDYSHLQVIFCDIAVPGKTPGWKPKTSHNKNQQVRWQLNQLNITKHISTGNGEQKTWSLLLTWSSWNEFFFNDSHSIFFRSLPRCHILSHSSSTRISAGSSPFSISPFPTVWEAVWEVPHPSTRRTNRHISHHDQWWDHRFYPVVGKQSGSEKPMRKGSNFTNALN